MSFDHFFQLAISNLSTSYIKSLPVHVINIHQTFHFLFCIMFCVCFCFIRTAVISMLGLKYSQKEDLMPWMKQLFLGYAANMGFP